MIQIKYHAITSPGTFLLAENGAYKQLSANKGKKFYIMYNAANKLFFHLLYYFRGNACKAKSTIMK